MRYLYSVNIFWEIRPDVGGLGSFLHVWHIWKCRSTGTFYGMKLSRCVKKLMCFEGRTSDNFSIEIYRRNLVFLVHIFLLFDLRGSKSCWHGRVQSVLTKLCNFIGKDAKILEILSNFCYFSLKPDFLKITQVGIFSS